MDALRKVIDDYVADMQPRGTVLSEELAAWLEASANAEAWQDGSESLANDIHKFAGSAGQSGFPVLSACSILLEVGLRALQEKSPYHPLDYGQLACLVRDFQKEIQALVPEKSSVVSGHEDIVFARYLVPPQIILADIPTVTERILTYVIEQKLGFAYPASSVVALDQIPEDRKPDLAIVSKSATDYSSRYSFPVFVYEPVHLAEIGLEWGLEVE